MTNDQMNNANHRRVGNAAMACVDAVQDMRAEDQLLGLAACFLLACEHRRMNPHEALRAVTYVMNHADNRRRPEFGAVALYMSKEWKR